MKSTKPSLRNFRYELGFQIRTVNEANITALGLWHIVTDLLLTEVQWIFETLRFVDGNISNSVCGKKLERQRTYKLDGSLFAGTKE